MLNIQKIRKNINYSHERLFTDPKTSLQGTPIWGESFQRVSKLTSFSQKNGFVFADQIWHYKALNQYFMAQKIRFRLLVDFKTNLQEAPIYEESFREVSRFASLFQKNDFVFVHQIWHYKALNQYSMAHKIRFKLFIDFKANLQEAPIYGESFREVSRFASLFQKNGFVFVEQILHF